MHKPLLIQIAPVLCALFLWGCPRAAKPELGRDTPGVALQTVIEAARSQDENRFKEGLSRNFIATVERYQEFSKQKAELRGAFAWPVFMRSLAQSAPLPKEELIEGNKATVKAVFPDGREVKTEMVFEEGTWRLAVPPGMVRDLDHFEQLQEKLTGAKDDAANAASPAAAAATEPRPGEVQADKSSAAPAKASALAAFDSGDLQKAEPLLRAALQDLPTDEELVVALGRLYVRQGQSAKARELLSRFVAAAPKSVRARHYLGMAHMLENDATQAIASWQEVISLDPKYAKEFRLGQRIEAAKSLSATGVGRHPIPAGPTPAGSP